MILSKSNKQQGNTSTHPHITCCISRQYSTDMAGVRVRIKIFCNFQAKSLESTPQSSSFASQIPKSVCPVHTLWHQTPQPKPNKTPKSPPDAPKYVTDSGSCPIIFSPKPLLREQHTMRIFALLNPIRC